MQRAPRKAHSRFGAAGVLSLALLAILAPSRAQADNNTARRIIHELFGIGGYWFTDNSAVDALGTPKFSGSTTLYVRPAHRGPWLVTGGIELFGASDHWVPFTGGNSFSLSGPAFRISTERRVGRFSPFVTGGLFVGNIHSVKQDFDETRFVPSISFGTDFMIHRYVTLSASYRISGHMHDVNVDGFRLGLRLF